MAPDICRTSFSFVARPWIAVVFLTLLPAPAANEQLFSAQSSAIAQIQGADCNQPAGRTAALEALKPLVANLANMVEAVPPSEEAYIRAEESQAFASLNSARMELVMKNEFWNALQVRDSASKIIDRLSAAQSYERRDALEKRNAMEFHPMTSLGAQAFELMHALADLTDFSGSMRDYMDYDLTRAQRVLSARDRHDVSILIIMAKGAFLSVGQCIVLAIDQQR